MKVVSHEPHVWFLLEDAGHYYMDVRVTRSSAEWTVLIRLNVQEYREYHAMGSVYLHYLAARIHNFVEEYRGRNLEAELGNKVSHAIDVWRSSSR